MPSLRCDKRRLALAAIAVIANAGYTTIAPILPLEVEKRGVPEQWVSLIFLAFSVGSAVAPPIVARHFESAGTVKVVACAMAGMSAMFWCTGMVFDIAQMISPGDEDAVGAGDGAESQSYVAVTVALLTVIQFLLGAFFSSIATGYYSLATLMFVEKESAMSGEYLHCMCLGRVGKMVCCLNSVCCVITRQAIEASVGAGYMIGPIIGSLVYDKKGFQYAFSTFISLVMLAMAFVTWKLLAPLLKHKANEAVGEDDDDDVDDDGGSESDVEAQSDLLSYDSMDTRSGATKSPFNVGTRTTRQPSIMALLRNRNILLGALTILWIDVAW